MFYSHIRQYQQLFAYMDLIYVFPIDDQAFPDPNKQSGLLFHLPFDDLLEMRQVERKHLLGLVVQHHRRVIPVRTYIYNPFRVDSDQLIHRTYDNRRLLHLHFLFDTPQK